MQGIDQGFTDSPKPLQEVGFIIMPTLQVES